MVTAHHLELEEHRTALTGHCYRYQASFHDPDGHHREVIHMDPAAIGR